ncbi:Transcription initiation factor IIA subunit 1 [Halotydeus destructor]|nr:Transcription initiation factor IIA subunit 1 [Halotydeus destructor]
MAGNNSNMAYKVYQSVIEDVISNVREMFLDDGVDEQILQELKSTWQKRLQETKTVEPLKETDQLSTPAPTTGGRRGNQAGGSKARAAAEKAAALQQQQQQNAALQPLPLQNQSQSSTEQHPQLQQQLQPPPQTQQQQQPSSIQTAVVRQGPVPITQQPQQQQFQVIVDQNGRIMQLPGGGKVMIQNSAGGMLMSSAAQMATLALPAQIAPGGAHHMPAIFSGGVLNVSQQQASVLQHTNQATAAGIQFTTGAPQTSQAATRPPQPNRIVQLDGPNDSSDEDEEEDEFRENDDDHDDDNDDDNDAENEFPGEDEVEPLNSEDDVSDEDPSELFDVENVVVCQYDKITRSRNKWKFHFKDGIMNLKGKDFVFQKAVGDAEW